MRKQQNFLRAKIQKATVQLRIQDVISNQGIYLGIFAFVNEYLSSTNVQLENRRDIHAHQRVFTAKFDRLYAENKQFNKNMTKLCGIKSRVAEFRCRSL